MPWRPCFWKLSWSVGKGLAKSGDSGILVNFQQCNPNFSSRNWTFSQNAPPSLGGYKCMSKFGGTSTTCQFCVFSTHKNLYELNEDARLRIYPGRTLWLRWGPIRWVPSSSPWLFSVQKCGTRASLKAVYTNHTKRHTLSIVYNF